MRKTVAIMIAATLAINTTVIAASPSAPNSKQTVPTWASGTWTYYPDIGPPPIIDIAPGRIMIRNQVEYETTQVALTSSTITYLVRARNAKPEAYGCSPSDHPQYIILERLTPPISTMRPRIRIIFHNGPHKPELENLPTDLAICEILPLHHVKPKKP